MTPHEQLNIDWTKATLKGDVQKITLNYITNQPEGQQIDLFNLAEGYYLSQQYDKAILVYEQLYKQGQVGSVFSTGTWHYLSRIGSSLVKLGNTEETTKILDQLQQKEAPNPIGRIPMVWQECMRSLEINKHQCSI